MPSSGFIQLSATQAQGVAPTQDLAKPRALWSDPADDLSCPRRRGDRITTFFTAAQNVRFWHKADILVAPGNVRFRG
jgi:hypothetical protein